MGVRIHILQTFQSYVSYCIFCMHESIKWWSSTSHGGAKWNRKILLCDSPLNALKKNDSACKVWQTEASCRCIGVYTGRFTKQYTDPFLCCLKKQGKGLNRWLAPFSLFPSLSLLLELSYLPVASNMTPVSCPLEPVFASCLCWWWRVEYFLPAL